MKAEITIKIDGKELSYDEAKELYIKLKQVFDDRFPYFISPYKSLPNTGTPYSKNQPIFVI